MMTLSLKKVYPSKFMDMVDIDSIEQ